jgi:hypothetical protein
MPGLSCVEARERRCLISGRIWPPLRMTPAVRRRRVRLRVNGSRDARLEQRPNWVPMTAFGTRALSASGGIGTFAEQAGCGVRARRPETSRLASAGHRCCPWAVWAVPPSEAFDRRPRLGHRNPAEQLLCGGAQRWNIVGNRRGARFGEHRAAEAMIAGVERRRRTGAAARGVTRLAFTASVWADPWWPLLKLSSGEQPRLVAHMARPGPHSPKNRSSPNPRGT